MIVLDPVSDGKHVILIMLITGLIFLAVIGLGELAHRASESVTSASSNGHIRSA
jgi:hypothetical protein